MNNDKPDDNPLKDTDAAAIDLIRQKLDRLYAKPETNQSSSTNSNNISSSTIL